MYLYIHYDFVLLMLMLMLMLIPVLGVEPRILSLEGSRVCPFCYTGGLIDDKSSVKKRKLFFLPAITLSFIKNKV